MTQEKVWEAEYKRSKLLTKENKPQADVVRFVKYLNKQFKLCGGQTSTEFGGKTILDLGSGIGRNSFYFAGLGAKMIGFEISQTAIDIAKNNLSMSKMPFDIEYRKQSIGKKFPLEDGSVDIVLDVTSSNSLTEREREVCLSETNRVLKRGGYFFVKALCKDGDDNAKYLLKNNPGKEKDTYIIPELGVTERVWSREDFTSTYEKYFSILNLEKKTSYSRMNNRSYKRNFWLAYMKK